MKIITLKDIAQMLNVSPSTVSRALKNHPDIGIELKEKIQSIAQTLNYKPNSIAANLRNKKSHLIGVIIPKFFSNFIPDVIDGISKIITEENYQMIIIPTNDELDNERAAVLKCIDYRVEGILISLSTQTHDLSHLSLVSEYDIPLVIFDKSIPNTTFPQVLINDEALAYDAGNFLLSNGKKNIAAFFGHQNLSISQTRYKGFRSAIDEHRESATYIFSDNTNDAYAKTIEILANQEINAIFAMSDQLMIGIIAALVENGKLETIELIHFSDGKTLPFIYPQISYILHSGQLIGETAAQALFKIIHSDWTGDQVQLVQSSITKGKK